MSDIWTMMLKEWKEIFDIRGRKTRNLVGGLMLSGVFTVIGPWQIGRGWVESPAMLLNWVFLAALVSVTPTLDAFAGERERHSLETLLASRLPDRAILFGKLLAAVAYGWVMVLIWVTMGLVVVNILDREPGLIMYPPWLALAILTLSLLGALCYASIGILISLRAPTMRQAQQTLSTTIMLLFLGPLFAGALLPEDWRLRVFQGVQNFGAQRLVLDIGIVLFVLDVFLISAARQRFRRGRLNLD